MEYPDQPVSDVKWIYIDKIKSNDYNPNSVAINELKLLYISILHDGFTQPIVTIYDKENDEYIIVDGFHRYLIMKTFKDIYERTSGYLPVVVINKGINDRMASTIRHNRARGKHSIYGLGNIVFSMLEKGWEDNAICSELGMEADELIRLKHVTGFSKLFENMEYKKAWETDRQVMLRREIQGEEAKIGK